MLLVLLACRPDGPGPDPDPAPSDTGEPHTPSDDPCERVRGGPSGTEGVLGLSVAHADVRLFGTARDYNTADAGLIAAMGGEDPVNAPDLSAYADAVEGVCLLAADDTALGAASVVSEDGMWWVKPGTGAVEVPDDGAPVVLDLRGLPAADGLDDALTNALAAVAVGDVTLPLRKVRVWNGLVDQFYSGSNVYSNDHTEIGGDVVTGVRSSGTLLVLTEDQMAPAAVELAGAVALGGHGHLVGVDVLASVAEMHWSPVGDQGLAWRSELLEDAEDTWPDVIEASVHTDAPEAVLPTLDLDTLVAPGRGGDDRDGIRDRDPWNEVPDATASVGTFRAALVIVHGGLRRFFPYFEVVGDTIDDRLLEVLADDIDPTDLLGQRERLGRLGNAITDGHQFAGLLDPTGVVAGYVPVALAQVDGLPVVAHSGVEGLDVGDTLTAIDGVPIEDWKADWDTWHGGATEGYHTDLVYREARLCEEGAEVFTLVDPDGVEEELTIEPQVVDALYEVPITWYLRENGTLDDLGHPEVAYLNLASEVTTDLSQVDDVLALAAGSDGLIVDMRGYPGVNHYTVLSALIPGDYQTPVFRVPTWTGPDQMEMVESQYTYTGDDDAYGGPIVLLVSPITVSAAENFSQMLVGSGRVTAVVGSPSSAGTNGNITGFTLPGSYFMSFTGMEILNPDRSRFHGVGIVSDVVVEPTAADLRDGTDPVLEAGIEVLAGG